MTRTISLPCRIAGALCIAQLALAAPTGAQVLLGQAAPEGDVDNPVEAQLVADTTAMRPGTTFTLGVLLKLQPEWHVYWTNPGEVGYATTFEWTLPD